MKKLTILLSAIIAIASIGSAPAFARKGADDGCAVNDCGIDNHGGRGKHHKGKHGKDHHGPNHQ